MQLNAIDAQGRLTEHRRRMAECPLHPRLAHMVLSAIPLGLSGLACDLAALLESGISCEGHAGGAMRTFGSASMRCTATRCVKLEWPSRERRSNASGRWLGR